MIKWIATLLAVIATVGIIFQWRAINQLRADNTALQSAEFESSENAASQRDANTESSQAGNLELLRLRNEASQLRSRLPELAKARAENEILLAEQKAALTNQSAPNTVPEGFLAKHQLANLGQDSPEAVLQTFFSAMRDGNLELLAQCASPPLTRQLGLDRMKPGDAAAGREQLRGMLMQQMESFTNMRIVNRQDFADDWLVLSVQSNPRGGIATVTVVKFDNGWRVDKLF